MKTRSEKIIQSLAQAILRKYQPQIVVIAGSAGVATTTSLSLRVLAQKKTVRRCTIPDTGTVFRSIIGSDPRHGKMRVFLKALWMLLVPALYPKVLLFEGESGQLKKLSPIFSHYPPFVVALTQSSKKYAAEIQRLLIGVPQEGYVVLNGDTQISSKEAQKLNSHVLWYSAKKEGVAIQAEDVKVTHQGRVSGIQFKLLSQGTAVPVFVPRLDHVRAVSCALSAATVGVVYGLTSLEIAAGLEEA